MIVRTIIICSVIVFISIFAILLLNKNKPKPAKVEITTYKSVIKVFILKKSNINMQITTRGFLKPFRQTKLVSQVAGEVIHVSDKFKPGTIVKKDDILLEIDDSDYESILSQAKSNLSKAKLNLEQEKVRASKAKRDWKSIGRGNKASPLVLREPNLKVAQDTVQSAQANLEKAIRDVQRCIIKAPYDARITQTYTDFGNVLAQGIPIADFYETGKMEINLPINLSKLENIHTHDLTKNIVKLWTPSMLEKSSKNPEPTQNNTQKQNKKHKVWNGHIARLSGTINPKTRSIEIITSLKVPEQDLDVLVPGLFINANIIGKTLENVFKIPKESINSNGDIFLVNEQNKITKVSINSLYEDHKFIYFKSEQLTEGDRISTISLDDSMVDSVVEITQ